MMYYDNFFGFGIFGGIFMIIFMLLFWAGIIYLIVWAIRGFVSGPRENKTAEEILRQRYAKGEINKEEFEEKKKDLNG
ncbi:MAG: SHOCT domain-containing protein [Patescibacteria group bacterium]